MMTTLSEASATDDRNMDTTQLTLAKTCSSSHFAPVNAFVKKKKSMNYTTVDMCLYYSE